jgi:4-amino-4-deoxy-L-arabinose transferase-like glycosyltransferase
MNTTKRSVFLLIVLTLLTRSAAVILYPSHHYFTGISDEYLQVIQNVFEGRGFVVLTDISRTDSEQRQYSYEPLIDRPLGYAVLLLVPGFFSTNHLFIRFVHIFFSVGTVLLLYIFAKRIVSERKALIAALLYAVWPISARLETCILADAVMSLMLLASCTLLQKQFRDKRAILFMFLSGCVIGIATTIRSDVVLIPFVVILWLWISEGKKIWKCAIIFLFGFTMIISIHTVRNYCVTEGAFLPLGLGNGVSMWEGISQFGDTLGTVYGDERMVALEGYHSWAYPNGIARDQRRFQQALEIIKDHPWWYTKVMLKRINILLKPDRIVTAPLLPIKGNSYHQQESISVVKMVQESPIGMFIQGLLTAIQLTAFLLAIIALIFYRRQPNFLLPGFIIFYYIVIHIVTNAEARYFYPAMPFVFLLAVAGWNCLFHNHKEREELCV